MDFFTVTTVPAPVVVDSVGPAAATTFESTTSEGVDAFAEAINARYSRAGTSLIPLSPNQHGSTAQQPLAQAAPTSFSSSATMSGNNAPLLTLRAPPPPRLSSSTTSTAPLAAPESRLAASQPSPSTTTTTTRTATTSTATTSAATLHKSLSTTPSPFTALLPNALSSVLAEPALLILDIRPHNTYAIARLPAALSISVPSTLLKRPLFSLDRLAQMLSPATRTRFSTWPTASRILVYDADTTTLAEGGNILGLLRKLRSEGFAGELAWLKGGFKAIWREQYDLVDQNAPLEDEDEDGELPSLQSAPGQPRPPPGLALEPTPGISRTTKSAPAKTASFPPPTLLRTKNLAMSAFTSSTTTSQRPYRPGEPSDSSISTPTHRTYSPISKPKSLPGVNANVVPATPMPTRADPFALLGAPTPSTSSSSQSSFALRLPPALGRTSSTASTSTIPEGQTMHIFPPRSGPHGPGAVLSTASSLPTQGAGAAYGMLPRERPHYNSLPGVTVAQQSVPFNPFFDTIRQNLELGGGRGSGEGIPLKLSRRVRRRVSDLPFEWLRDIARKSGKASEESTSTDSDKDEHSAPGKKTVLSAARLAPGASDVSESEDELAGTHHHRRRRLDTKLHKTVLGTSTGASPGSPSLEAASTSDGEELAKNLAMQFYKIELGEQRRLMGVMEHHSMESSTVVSEGSASRVAKMSQAMSKSATVGGFTMNSQGIPSGGLCGPMQVLPGGAHIAPSESPNTADKAGQTYTGTATSRMLAGSVSEAGGTLTGAGTANIKDREKAFPFSITAGVEKGDKNRYRNIWPFEHARVRLHKSRPNDDDYMNASYVQPLGTTKRYIATQGPLPSTFTDFWTLCWQENIHVIVMLTREVESALVKCGNYWAEGEYGPLRLKLISTNDTPERESRRRASEMSSGFFNIPQARSQTQETLEDQMIRRVFELTHSGYPKAPPRTVTQLQYLDWPDLDVPKDPRGLLNLMQEVDDVVERSRLKGTKRWGEGPLKKQAPQILAPSEESKSSTSSDSEADGKEVLDKGGLDPTTGIAHHARENPPVLLHCSAGVGRTGGFIAVDAVLDGVRREMRKRKEEQMRVKLASGTGSPASSATRPSMSGSPSPAAESDEAMEVDDGSSANGSPLPGPDDRHSVSVSVGVDRRDLPPAGGSQQPMDVDSHAPVQQTSRPSGVIQPSAELISEVRQQHAHLMQIHTKASIQRRDYGGISSEDSSRTSVLSPAPLVASPFGSMSETGSLASLASGSRSTSTSVPSTSISRTSGSVGSSKTNSTSSLNSFVKSAEALIPEEHDRQRSNMSTAATSGSVHETGGNVQPVPSNAQDLASDAKVQGGTATSRLDSWRAGIQRDGRHTSDDRSSNESPEQDKMLPTPRTMAFDYTSPRPLHNDASPPPLSTYAEPIRRVIEDMREQRMSLCQSLRQYVFVHRAIIEGALMVVDEERRRAKEEDEEMLTSEKEINSAQGSTRESSADLPDARMQRLSTVQDRQLRRASLGLDVDKAKDHMAALHYPAPRAVSIADVHMGEHPALQPSPGLPSPRSKRQASPTELVQTDSSGSARLVKRPSVKRSMRSPEVLDDGLKLNAMVLSSPPPGGE